MRTRKTSSEKVKKEPKDYMQGNKKRRCISEAASCINPKFEDEKYISSRKVDDFFYSIYVKPAKPEVRDAMMFINIAFQRRESLFEDVQGKAEARVYMRTAIDRLLAYVDEKIGFLRLFFIKSNEVFPLTGIIMHPEMWREEFPFELLLELIDSYDDERLFAMLLMFLHTKKKVSRDFVKRIMADRKILVLYLDGASYEFSVKQDILRMYEMTSLSNKSNPSLKVLLKQFIFCLHNAINTLLQSSQLQIFFKHLFKFNTIINNPLKLVVPRFSIIQIYRFFNDNTTSLFIRHFTPV